MRKLLVLIVLSLSTQLALAETIRVDFQGGAYTLPSSWNIVTDRNITTTDLKDIEETTTAVDLITSGFTGTGGAPGFDTDVDWLDLDATKGSFVTGTTGYFTFSGLEIGSEWSVDLVASHGVDYLGNYKVNGDWGSSNYQGGMSGNIGESWNINDARLAKDWMIWDSVTADSSGEIQVSVENLSGWTALNAVQLTAVPEPATAGLLTISGLLIAVHRRFFGKV